MSHNIMDGHTVYHQNVVLFDALLTVLEEYMEQCQKKGTKA